MLVSEVHAKQTSASTVEYNLFAITIMTWKQHLDLGNASEVKRGNQMLGVHKRFPKGPHKIITNQQVIDAMVK